MVANGGWRESMQNLSKLVVFHDDPEISDRVSNFAAEINLDVIRPTARAELQDSLRDPLTDGST